MTIFVLPKVYHRNNTAKKGVGISRFIKLMLCLILQYRRIITKRTPILLRDILLVMVSN